MRVQRAVLGNSPTLVMERMSPPNSVMPHKITQSLFPVRPRRDRTVAGLDRWRLPRRSPRGSCSSKFNCCSARKSFDFFVVRQPFGQWRSVFQLLFLAAYGYSHGLATCFPLRAQVIVHARLLGSSVVLLAVLGYSRSTPIGPGAGWRPQPGANPTWTIAEFLIGAIGLPFFLLSATSPLMQHWLARTASKRSPYRL